jgi:hypothetical protein
MCEKLDIPISELRVIAIFKDWRESDKLKNKDYPPQKVMYISIKRLPNEKIEAYLRGRVRLHRMAENGIMECTAKDRWTSPDTYAVLKKNGTRALAKFVTEDEARMYVKLNNHRYSVKESLFVQVRKGGSKRCEGGYCPVAKFCSQFKNEIESKQNEELD